MFAGAMLWWWLTPSYDALLAGVAAPLLRIDRRLAGAELTARGRTIVMQSRTIPSAQIPADQLTYNVILLFALFASDRKPLRDHNMKRFALSLLILAVVHCIALVVSIESTYAVQQAAWSEAHYSAFAAKLWLDIELFYRLVGMFAVVFICWWPTSAA